jgi:hypothetical protein
MKGTKFKKLLTNVGLNQVTGARFLGLSLRHVQRIAAEEYELDRAAALLLLTMEHWNLRPHHVDPTWKDGI